MPNNHKNKQAKGFCLKSDSFWAWNNHSVKSLTLSLLAASILTFFSCFRNEITWLTEKREGKKRKDVGNNTPVQPFHKEGIFTSKRNENQMMYAKKWRHFIVVFKTDHQYGHDHHQICLVFTKDTSIFWSPAVFCTIHCLLNEVS